MVSKKPVPTQCWLKQFLASVKGYTGESNQNLNFRPWIQSHLHKKCKQKCQIWHQIKMQNKKNQEKNLHHQWQRIPCVVSAPILYRVSIFATSYLIAWRPSGYTGVDILLLLRYSLDLAKILICLNLQKEEEEEDVTNHKSKQGLKQEVTPHTVTRPPMLFVAHW